MIFKTQNGLIDISPNVFGKIAAHAAENCFGIKELRAPTLTESVLSAKGRSVTRRGVLVTFDHGKVFITLRVSMVNGVNIQAVCASVRNEVRYHVEKYTGVKVSEVRISVETVSAE